MEEIPEKKAAREEKERIAADKANIEATKLIAEKKQEAQKEAAKDAESKKTAEANKEKVCESAAQQKILRRLTPRRMKGNVKAPLQPKGKREMLRTIQMIQCPPVMIHHHGRSLRINHHRSPYAAGKEKTEGYSLYPKDI